MRGRRLTRDFVTQQSFLRQLFPSVVQLIAEPTYCLFHPLLDYSSIIPEADELIMPPVSYIFLVPLAFNYGIIQLRPELP